MSLTSLRLMQEETARSERAEDRSEAGRARIRRQKLPEAELKAQTQKLVAVVMDRMSNKLPVDLGEGKCCWQINMRTVRPEQVYDNVIAALKECNLSARHTCNDGYNTYDTLNITIGKEAYKKMVMSLFQ
jgi:hypothetical protein